MKKNWLFVFAIVLIADLIGVYLKNEALIYIAKPLIVISLILYFFPVTSGISNGLKKLITAALIFSWLGDVLLMFESSDKNFFLFGLVSFLIAHIFYIISFKKISKGEKLNLKWIFILPVLIYYGGLMYLLNSHLGDMLWAVRVYGFVISTMFLLALHMPFIKNRGAGKLMMFGALLFVASDSILAINKFYLPFEYAGIFIMLAYGLAQLLITIGAANYINFTSRNK